MSKVWLVTSGEYSNYRICAIFAEENETMAREFAAGLSPEYGDAGEVEEWELNTWTRDQGRWEFTFDFSGNIVEEKYEADIVDVSEDPDVTIYRKSMPDRLRITVEHGNREHAVKVASERYTRIRAFLDEVDRRIARNHRIASIPDGEYYREHLSVEIAKILAGLSTLPEPPECREHQDIHEIIHGIKTSSD